MIQVIFLLMSLSVRAFALDPASSKIEWFKPETGPSENLERSQVILSGRATPGTEIRLSNDQVFLLDAKGEVQSIPVKEAFPKEVAIADSHGMFDILLDLPFMTAQLPFEVKSPSGESKIYQLNVVVQKNAVQIANTKAQKKSPYAPRKWSVWGGLGSNLLTYDQESSIPSNLSFKSYDVPAIFAKISRTFEKNWLAQGTFNYSPGKTSSSEQIQVADGEYQWTFVSANVTYFKPSWKSTLGKNPIQFGIQGGFQYQLVPFVQRTSTSDPQVASVVTNELIMANVGGISLIQFDRYWSMETFLRYHLPISSGSVFKVQPQLAFDGSIGGIYKFSPQWRAGFFWYGQYQKYGFSDHEDTYAQANGGSKITGTQAILFSNVEARLGYEFD